MTQLASYRVFSDSALQLAPGNNQTFQKNLPNDVVATDNVHAVVKWRDRCLPQGTDLNYTMAINGNNFGTFTADDNRSYTRHEVIKSSLLNAGGNNTIEVTANSGSGTGHFADIVLEFKVEPPQ